MLRTAHPTKSVSRQARTSAAPSLATNRESMSHTSDPSFDGRLSPSTFGPSALSLGEDRAGKRKQEDDCDSDDPFACSSKRSKESPKDQVITDKATLDALDNLTHHATRFNVETSKMDVCTLIQWHLTNLVRPSQLVFPPLCSR